MVLRGLDDVSEIVMRAGAGEWACQPQPAPDLAPASWHQRMERDRESGTWDRMDAGDLQYCRPEPPTAAQTAGPGGCGLQQSDCLQWLQGAGPGGWGRGLPDGAIRMSGTARPGDSGTLMVSQRTGLDCLNAEMMIAAVKNVPVY